MKKLMLILLSLILCFSTFACGDLVNNSDKESTVNNDNITSKDDSSSAVSDNSSETISENSNEFSNDISSETSNNTSSAVSNDISNNESSDISNEKKPNNRLPVSYDNWDDFYASEASNFVRLLNADKLRTIINSEIYYTNYYNQFYMVDIMGEKNNECIFTIYATENADEKPWHKSNGIFSVYAAEPMEEILYFPLTNCNCFHYIKEGIDMYLIGEEDAYSLPDKRKLNLLYVAFKIDGYIFIVELLLTLDFYIDVTDLQSQEALEELKPKFEDAMWKYELLNIYNEDSEFIALLKEMVAEQG